jgi:transposase
MKHKTVAVDIAKDIFEIAVSEKPGQVSQQKRLSRSRFLLFFTKIEPATVLLEACGSAHFWGREIQKFGHTVILLPPHLVCPYRRCNKHDRADTKAILEAQRNEEIQPVPVKTVEQQTLASLHRLRSGWLDTRTARINAVRGLLRELGFFIPKGARHLVPHVLALVEDAESELPNALRPYLYEACTEIRELETRMKKAENQLEALAKQNPAVKRLLTIPGIGLLTATALVGFIGDLKRFRSGRHFASYLGLVPKERSSGNIRRLGRITKHGDSYIRMLLSHGGRSVLRAAKVMKQPDRLRSWALKVATSRGHNKATIAVANKLARIAWAVSTRNQDFQSVPVAA